MTHHILDAAHASLNSMVKRLTWVKTAVAEISCMCRWYDLVLAAEDDIATIMTMEGGKPLKESKGEFASGCRLLSFACSRPQLAGSSCRTLCFG